MTAAGSVVVIGAGIAGLVCARALALSGARVTVLERRTEIEDEGGIGIGLQSNAMEALGRIGLAQRCIDRGVPVDTIFLHAPDGSQIAGKPTARHAGTSWPGFTGMSRATLHAILAEGAEQAGATLVTGAEVAGVDQGDARAAVTLADGRVLPADLVVGADGIHSRLRGALFPEHATAVPMEEGVWRALIPGERRSDVRMMFGGDVGTIGYTPLPDDLYLYVVDRRSRGAQRGDPDPARRLTERIGAVPGFPGELARKLSHAPGDVTFRPIEAVRLPRPWHAGCTVLIGDAAHAGPPTLAQGAAMGIEDGVVLAECVARAIDIPAALENFMDRRHQRVSTVVDAAIAISRAQMEPDGQARVRAAQAAAVAVLATPF